MGQMSCLETTVRNYHCTLRNIPEERGNHSYTSVVIGKVACVPRHHATNVWQAVEKCSIILRLGTMGTSFTSQLLYSNVKRVYRPRTDPHTVVATEMLSVSSENRIPLRMISAYFRISFTYLNKGENVMLGCSLNTDLYCRNILQNGRLEDEYFRYSGFPREKEENEEKL